MRGYDKVIRLKGGLIFIKFERGKEVKKKAFEGVLGE